MRCEQGGNSTCETVGVPRFAGRPAPFHRSLHKSKSPPSRSCAGNFARTRSLQVARGTSRARARYEFRVPIAQLPNLKIHSPCDFKKRTSPFKNIVRGKTCTRREFRPFACLPEHENQSTRSPPLHSEASGGIDCSAQRFALYGLIKRLQSS